MKIQNIVVELYSLPPRTNWPRPGQFMAQDDMYGGRLRVIADNGTEGRASFGVAPRVGHGYSEHATRVRAAQMLRRQRGAAFCIVQ